MVSLRNGTDLDKKRYINPFESYILHMSKIGEIVLVVAVSVALLKLFVPYGLPSGFITEIICADAFGLFLGSFFTFVDAGATNMLGPLVFSVIFALIDLVILFFV
jgi:hypothetical protein